MGRGGKEEAAARSTSEVIKCRRCGQQWELLHMRLGIFQVYAVHSVGECMCTVRDLEGLVPPVPQGPHGELRLIGRQ